MDGLKTEDEAEFRAFVQARRAVLVRTAYLLTGDPGEAEDLAQTVLAKVFTAWRRVARVDNPDAYVHRVLVNANRSRYRRRRVQQLLTHSPPDRATADPAERVAVRGALMSALDRLPPGRRAVVVLRYWSDLPESQVAEVLGCGVGTVRSQAHKGLAQLRADPEVAVLLPGSRDGAESPGDEHVTAVTGKGMRS